MTVTVKHSKTNAISDWTQAQLDEQIALGNFPAGTTLANIVLPSDWNNDHTLTGVGTMAEQNANNVAITGGTATLSSVTTPSVTATTLDLALNSLSTGSVNFNSAGGQLFKIADGGAYGGYWTAYSASGSPSLRAVGSVSGAIDTNSAVPIQFRTNIGTSGAEQFRVAHTASAVNYVQVTGAATTAAPVISSQGSDTNIALSFVSKGTARHNFFNNGATSSRQFAIGTSGITSAVNFLNVDGSVSGIALPMQAQGTDTNISMAFQPKGTGAIDLAAGSSGVNISNGGTVTAITTATRGAGYTALPSVALSAPTTAGGVQATASALLNLNTLTLVSGGTGYSVNDVLTVSGITGGTVQLTVNTVSAGVISTFTVTNFGGGTISTIPANPVSVTGGTGTGATFTANWNCGNITVGTAGSGYVEQPTVTITGGSSNATAYATVGSMPIIRSLAGSAASTDSLSFYTPAGESVRIKDQGVASSGYVQLQGASATSGGSYVTSSYQSLYLSATGGQQIGFFTNGQGITRQATITHTASANRYAEISGGLSGTSAPGIGTGGGNEAFDIFSNANAIRFSTGGAKASSLQFTVASTSSPVNYFSVTGSPTTKAVIKSVIGSDTNISSAIVSKGTGGVDLATGSTGVNISNGLGNVTALARTVAGSGYTTPPTWTATAPQTNGGTTASGSVDSIGVVTATVSAGGTGYAVGNVLTIVGGTSTTAATVTVATLSGSAVATVTISNAGAYTAVPANPAATTGGTGTGATFTLSFGINNSFTITTAGTGYLEQPTISFSGGGGASAAAVATVGSATIVRSLGTAMSFYTPSGEAFRVSDNTTGNTAGYWTAYGQTVSPQLRAIGSTSGVIGTNSAVPLQFQTNMGTAPVEQFRVAHTATAVNYVQVTGNVTANPPIISAQGTDVSVGLRLATKSSAGMQFYVNSVRQVNISNTSSAVNYIDLTGGATGAPGFVTMSAQGTDANIDLVLNPKGTGLIKLGTAYVAGAPVATGYISVKDSTGTTYKILVST